MRGSNPFGLVVAADQLYVTDGGRNLVWQVDIPTGSFSPLATFPTLPNPLFPAVGGPVVEAVPTGIEYADGELLVTLFRGVPFAPGTSSVMQIDPATGVQSSFLSGLNTAIGVLGIKHGGEENYLVLQNSSGPAPFFAGPGLVLQFDSPGGASTVLADCRARPTAMLRDAKTGMTRADAHAQALREFGDVGAGTRAASQQADAVERRQWPGRAASELKQVTEPTGSQRRTKVTETNEDPRIRCRATYRAVAPRFCAVWIRSSSLTSFLRCEPVIFVTSWN